MFLDDFSRSTGCRLPLVTCQRLFRVSNLGAHDIRRVVSGRVTPPTHLFDCLEHATKLCMFLEHATKLCISYHAAVPKALLNCLPNVRVPNLKVQDLASVHRSHFCVCHYFVALLVARPRRRRVRDSCRRLQPFSLQRRRKLPLERITRAKRGGDCAGARRVGRNDVCFYVDAAGAAKRLLDGNNHNVGRADAGSAGDSSAERRLLGSVELGLGVRQFDGDTNAEEGAIGR